MIVRSKESGFVLIRQHEHGLVAGEISTHFSPEWLGSPQPSREVQFAVANHDLGWKLLDEEILWNEDKDRPYSFIDYPPAPKMAAYTRGIDTVECESRYAALLCSLHYRSFVEASKEPSEASFRERERVRQDRLESELNPEPSTLARDLRLLQLSDDLSLYVCFSEGGESHHPWFEGVFDLFGREVRPLWVEEARLRFEPNPFEESFRLRLGRRTIDREGNIIGEDVLGIEVEV